LHKYVVSGFSRTVSGPPDQPPLKLRRSAEALAKAEGGNRSSGCSVLTRRLPVEPLTWIRRDLRRCAKDVG
jgi:hypothetical protein